MFRKLLNYMSKYTDNPLNRKTLLQNMVIMEELQCNFEGIRVIFHR